MAKTLKNARLCEYVIAAFRFSERVVASADGASGFPSNCVIMNAIIVYSREQSSWLRRGIKY